MWGKGCCSLTPPSPQTCLGGIGAVGLRSTALALGQRRRPGPLLLPGDPISHPRCRRVRGTLLISVNNVKSGLGGTLISRSSTCPFLPTTLPFHSCSSGMLLQCSPPGPSSRPPKNPRGPRPDPSSQTWPLPTPSAHPPSRSSARWLQEAGHIPPHPSCPRPSGPLHTNNGACCSACPPP